MHHVRQLTPLIAALSRVCKVRTLELVALGTGGALIAVTESRKAGAYRGVSVDVNMRVTAVLLGTAAVLEIRAVRRAVGGGFVRKGAVGLRAVAFVQVCLAYSRLVGVVHVATAVAAVVACAFACSFVKTVQWRAGKGSDGGLVSLLFYLLT